MCCRFTYLEDSEEKPIDKGFSYPKVSSLKSDCRLKSTVCDPPFSCYALGKKEFCVPSKTNFCLAE